MEYWRTFKTNDEMIWYYKEPNLVHDKRKPNRLPTIWEDVAYITPRSWKYQSKKRGQHGFNKKKINKLKRRQDLFCPLENNYYLFYIID